MRFLVLVLAAWPFMAFAQDPTGVWDRSNLFGDLGGPRPWLESRGVTLELTETSEVLGNVTGGLKQGATYDGLTTLGVSVDSKALGWEGGAFHVSALQIHGRSLSEYYLSNLQTASGIEADPTTRFWEIWYEQSFLAGRASVKLGQQSVDEEFITSDGSALFVNTMMGWPMLPSADLYAGGPAYPLSSLGVRLKARLSDSVTVLGGVFQDNPPGGPFDDDGQLRGATRWGGNFNLRTGALAIAEIQYAVEPFAGLPGTYKVGFWYDTAGFPSQQFDAAGISLADSASDGDPKLVGPNYSFYAVADQTVWRPGGDSSRALSVFARVMGAPGDRNLIDFSLNAGVTLAEPWPGRKDDVFGIGYGLARVSDGARALDRATAFYSGGPYPVRSSESFVEVTYQAQVTGWLQLQPDFQYIFLPGGGIPNPNEPGQRIGNEAILGVRANVTF